MTYGFRCWCLENDPRFGSQGGADHAQPCEPFPKHFFCVVDEEPVDEEEDGTVVPKVDSVDDVVLEVSL